MKENKKFFSNRHASASKSPVIPISIAACVYIANIFSIGKLVFFLLLYADYLSGRTTLFC